MEFIQSVEAAVDAHVKWFTRLRGAIESGVSDFNPDIVKTDNKCDFGKWLYGELAIARGQTSLYKEIKILHAEFHRQAAFILRIALEGRKDEALRLMGSTEAFKKLSTVLIGKLRELKQSAAGG